MNKYMINEFKQWPKTLIKILHVLSLEMHTLLSVPAITDTVLFPMFELHIFVCYKNGSSS